MRGAIAAGHPLTAEVGAAVLADGGNAVDACIAAAFAAAGAWMWLQGGRYEETENAYVKAHIIAVSAEVAGRVAEVAVRDNQPVAAGALLFRLDPVPFEVEVARAEALAFVDHPADPDAVRRAAAYIRTHWQRRYGLVQVG